ncbi:MAG: zinc-dependent metalloprotease family protein [Chitinophagaceae bacterium]
MEQLEVLKSQLNAFFNIRVITLEPLAIPEKFRSSYNEKYSADSLLLLLSKLKNDTIIEVIGITNKEIYTYQKTKFKQGNKSVYLNERIGIYGLGYLAGSSCIVSDYKFIKNDEALLNNLTRKAILHEIGHNLGLKHCSDETCVMAEADGDISNLIKLGHDYCKNCRKKLK